MKEDFVRVKDVHFCTKNALRKLLMRQTKQFTEQITIRIGRKDTMNVVRLHEHFALFLYNIRHYKKQWMSYISTVECKNPDDV